jgi:gliding motility-associated-like protein
LKKFILKIVLVLLVKVSFAQVSADFIVNSTNGCAPFVVDFLDLSTGSVNSWNWDFGNGVTSTSQNPSFVYSQPGFYTITLTVSDDSSTDNEIKSSLIRVNASPLPNFSVNQDKGCSPHTPQFTDLSIPQSGTITQWYWAFGNGSTSTNQNPTTTFNDIKKYDTYLKVTDINGCEATITKNDFIELDGPKAAFEYDSVICGLPANVLFLNQSTGNSLDYYWEFGDGTTSTNEIPGVHAYTAFDSTEVLLAVTEQATGCTDTIRQSLVVGNYEATFDYNIICGDDEFTIEVDNTTPFYSQLEWNFNGESINFTDKASFHFNSGGSKDIILKATIDDSCFDTTLLKFTLPAPSFIYSAPICSDPFQVTFTNKSVGDDLTYNWDFSDSTFSTDINPYHEFDVPPELYRVKLYATDKFGCIDSGIVKVKVPFPIARFYEKDSIYTGCAPLSLTFSDTSYTLSSKVSTVHWDFGDPASGINNTSTSLSPSHSFNSPGDYDITYTIYTDDGCADTVTYKSIIKAGEKPTFLDFDQLLNDTICYGSSIHFIESATYATSTVQSNYFCWAFYESSTPLLLDPEKSPTGCPKIKQPYASNNDFVNYSNPSHRYLDFKTESTLIGDTFFTNNVNPNAGLLYTHLIIGYNNCYSEVIKSNFIDTTIALIGIAVKDSLVMFSDTTKTFGFFNASLNYDSVEFSYCRDNSSIDTLFNITKDTNYFELQEGHKYNIYTKIVNKTSGCENTIADQIVIDSVRIDFKMIDKQCYSDNPVLLDENSFSKYGDVTRRSWSVNGEIQFNNASDDSVYYNFPDTGVFNVSLEMEYRIQYLQNGIKLYNYYTKSVSKQIKIEGVKAKGLTDTLKVCGGDTIFFSDSSTSTTSIKSYSWRFGYSTDSITVKNSYHIYNDPGTFTPSLYVTDIFGCYDSISLPTITVNKPIINFTISDSLICKYDVVALKNKSEGKNLSFKWTIDTIKQSSPNIEHKFDSVGEFDVKLYAIDIFGCEDTLVKYKTIKVEGFPETNFEGDSLYKNCPPLASSFKDSTITPVVKWNWNFGDGKVSTEQEPTHIFTTPGFYTIQLITTNYAGCSDTLDRVDYIEIDGPNGAVFFDPDTLCIPEEVVFKHQLQNTVYFIWNYGDGTSISYNYSDYQDSSNYTYQKGGDFQPSIDLIDGSGCFYTLPQLPTIKADSIRANFETTDSIICDLFNIPFINISRKSVPSSYLWKFGNGDTSTQNSPLYSYLEDSLYDVTLIQTSPLGCVDSITKSIKVFNAPFPTLHIDNTNFCIPSVSDITIKFDNSNFIPDSVYFLLDNIHFNGDSLQTTISTSGNHDVKYMIEYGSGACRVDSLINVPFYEWPIADFSYTPSNNSMDEPVIFFTNLSTNSNSWLWDFDDFDQSKSKNPGHNFNSQGNYNISLKSTSLGGCSDTIIANITLAPYNFVKLPSGFSPNGDSRNETFGILRAGELEIEEFKIFNRWGNIVFETIDKNEKWDGRRKGKDQDVGTYIYYIKGKDKNGEVVEIKGNFTLLR